MNDTSETEPLLSANTVEQKRRSLNVFSHGALMIRSTARTSYSGGAAGLANACRVARAFASGQELASDTRRSSPTSLGRICRCSEIGHVATVVTSSESARAVWHIDADDFAERLKTFKVTTRRKKEPLSRKIFHVSSRRVSSVMRRRSRTEACVIRRPQPSSYFCFRVVYDEARRST